MKKFLCATFAFALCGISQASTVYTCKVGDRTLTYVEAKDSRTLTFTKGRRREHRDEDPQIEKSVFGTIVSTYYHAAPDRCTTYISIIIPRMNLENSGTLEFETLLSKTDKMTSFGGEHLVKGLLDVATHEKVTCSASRAH